MQAYYEEQWLAEKGSLSEDEKSTIAARVKREVRENRWDEASNTIMVNAAQQAAFEDVVHHYTRVFTDPNYTQAFRPTNYINDPKDLRDLSAFTFWGAWVTVAERPGQSYSYTHNWPYDPEAGNYPTKDTYVWSFLSIAALFIGIMAVLYMYGQMKATGDDPFKESLRAGILMSTPDLEKGVVRPTQRKTYRFYMLAAVAFGLQVLAGFLSVMDFADPFHETIAGILPYTVLRSYHTLLQIYWMFMCWVGYTIFFLPRLAPVPKYQDKLIDLLFWLCVIVGVGGVAGVYSGYNGLITGMMAYWFGSQGWEFMAQGHQKYVMEGVWLFVLAVNFWNIFAAGVLGSLLNLPIINYFEHATYITGNHAHGAMFGVKGNIALAGVLFCCQHLIKPEHWNARLIKVSFWALNIGLALMMFLALFPAGMYQLLIILESGYWAARVQEVTGGEMFRMFINLRGIGITIFSIGMLMMVWFLLSRVRHLRAETQPEGDNWANHENDWRKQRDEAL
jgi:nitric oxide reductase large subunit